MSLSELTDYTYSAINTYGFSMAATPDGSALFIGYGSWIDRHLVANGASTLRDGIWMYSGGTAPPNGFDFWTTRRTGLAVDGSGRIVFNDSNGGSPVKMQTTGTGVAFSLVSGSPAYNFPGDVSGTSFNHPANPSFTSAHDSDWIIRDPNDGSILVGTPNFYDAGTEYPGGIWRVSPATGTGTQIYSYPTPFTYTSGTIPTYILVGCPVATSDGHIAYISREENDGTSFVYYVNFFNPTTATITGHHEFCRTASGIARFGLFPSVSGGTWAFYTNDYPDVIPGSTGPFFVRRLTAAGGIVESGLSPWFPITGYAKDHSNVAQSDDLSMRAVLACYDTSYVYGPATLLIWGDPCACGTIEHAYGGLDPQHTWGVIPEPFPYTGSGWTIAPGMLDDPIGNPVPEWMIPTANGFQLTRAVFFDPFEVDSLSGAQGAALILAGDTAALTGDPVGRRIAPPSGHYQAGTEFELWGHQGSTGSIGAFATLYARASYTCSTCYDPGNIYVGRLYLERSPSCF